MDYNHKDVVLYVCNESYLRVKQIVVWHKNDIRFILHLPSYIVWTATGGGGGGGGQRRNSEDIKKVGQYSMNGSSYHG